MDLTFIRCWVLSNQQRGLVLMFMSCTHIISGQTRRSRQGYYVFFSILEHFLMVTNSLIGGNKRAHDVDHSHIQGTSHLIYIRPILMWIIHTYNKWANDAVIWCSNFFFSNLVYFMCDFPQACCLCLAGSFNLFLQILLKM